MNPTGIRLTKDPGQPTCNYLLQNVCSQSHESLWLMVLYIINTSYRHC